MNKTLLILSLIFFLNIFPINAQINKPDSSINQQSSMADFLRRKAKKQKTTAWILLGGGAGALVAGGAIATNSYNSSPRGTNSSGVKIGVAMMLAGVGAMIASIPVFLISGTNKHKANVIFRSDPQSFLHRFHKPILYSAGFSWRLQ